MSKKRRPLTTTIDVKPWDKKTTDERASCVLAHLSDEWLAGNLRPISEQGKRAKGQAPNGGK